MLLYEAQRADVCDDEAHFSPLEMAERMRTLLLEFLSGDRNIDTDCGGQGHPSWLWPSSILCASLFPNVGLSF